MASNEEDVLNAENKKCKYCKNNVDKIGVKCNVCKIMLHQSCALRIAGLQILSASKNLVLCPACCKNTRDDDVNRAICEAMAKKDEEILSLKQKIKELEEKAMKDEFNRLMERMEDMEKSILNKIGIPNRLENITQNSSVAATGNCQGGFIAGRVNDLPKTPNWSGTTPKIPPNQSSAAPIASKGTTGSATDNKPNYAAAAAHAPNRSASAVHDSSNKTKQSSNQPAIDRRMVNHAVLEAQTRNRMIELQKLGNENDENRENEWQKVRRRNRRYVVGRNETDTGIRAVPKNVSLHVTRLSPNTRPEDLQNMLSHHFPEVKCEEHISKHPSLYSSVKVTIKQDNFHKAWRKEIWPNGAIVSRFLTRKRKHLDPVECTPLQ